MEKLFSIYPIYIIHQYILLLLVICLITKTTTTNTHHKIGKIKKPTKHSRTKPGDFDQMKHFCLRISSSNKVKSKRNMLE